MKATTGRAILSARTPARLSVGFEAQCPDLRRTGWFAVCVVFMLFVRHRLDPSGMFRLRWNSEGILLGIWHSPLHGDRPKRGTAHHRKHGHLYPCPEWDSNPWSQARSGPTPCTPFIIPPLRRQLITTFLVIIYVYNVFRLRTKRCLFIERTQALCTNVKWNAAYPNTHHDWLGEYLFTFCFTSQLRGLYSWFIYVLIMTE
jgi:hypothetical protein